MNKTEYLEQLRQRLKSLPPGDLNDALDYYDGYLSDAENETDAIRRLGSPSEVAAQILANYVTKMDGTGKTPRKSMGMKTAWGVLLVLLSPVALPLTVTAIVLIIALFIVIFAIGISGLAAILAGAVAAVAVPFVFFGHFAYAVSLLGVALFAVGLGLLLVAATKVLWNLGVNGLLKFVGNKISGKDAR